MRWPELLAGQIGDSSAEAQLVRLTAAALLGGIIGLDREIRERPAGLRTHMLTSLAACTFTILTFQIVDAAGRLSDNATLDPIRVVEAVTAGVAFLAAGAIIRSGGDVHGLTTGAGMWMAGAVGVACGTARFGLALMATAIATAILVLLRWVEHRALRTKSAEPPPDGTEAGEAAKDRPKRPAPVRPQR